MDCVAVEKKDFIERYLTHDLSEQEEREFEEHYFQCENCANEVYLLQGIIHQAKEISVAEKVAIEPELVKEPISPIKKLWNKFSEACDLLLQPLTEPLAIGFAAMLVLFIIGGIKFIELKNQLRQPSINTISFALFPESTLKSAAQDLNVIRLPNFVQSVTLEFGIDEKRDYQSYSVKIMNELDDVIWQADKINPIGKYNTFSITAPKKFFAEKEYLLILSAISDKKEIEIKKFPFSIFFEE